MVEIETAANIADITGGIAILVSLIYVGYQVRQSNKIAKAESVRAIQNVTFMDQFDMAKIGRAFNDFDSLDYNAKWEFHSYFLLLWAHWQMILECKALGLVTERLVDAWTEYVAQIVLTPGVQQYFAQGGREDLMPQGLKIVEDYINNSVATIVPYNRRHTWMLVTE